MQILSCFIHVSSLRGWACQFLAWQFPCSHCRVKALWSENLHITLRLPGKDQSTQMKKHSMKCNKDYLFQSYRLFCIHVFSVVACYIWRNTRGLTAELPLIIRPTRSWFSCPMAFSSLPSGPDANSNPAYPVPKILNKFKNHEDAENASAFSCWMSEESWDLSQICPNPPKSCVAQSLQAWFQPSGKMHRSIKQFSWLELWQVQHASTSEVWSFFQTAMQYAGAYYRLSTNMHMWDPSPSSGCSELNLSRSKGANFAGTKLEILTAPVSRNKFHVVFCTKNPLTLGQKQLTAEENQSQISKCLQSTSSCATAACRCTCCWHEVKKLQVDPWYLGLMISEPYRFFCAFMINRRGQSVVKIYCTVITLS